jgi:hypothetical protein
MHAPGASVALETPARLETIRHQQPALALGLISDWHLRNVMERLGSELFMPLDCDLAAIVYDPPAPGFPHVAVLFDADGEVITVRPVKSIDEGEAALASLVVEFTSEQRATA